MDEMSFEQALEELKSVVQALEKADRSLDESLRLFERGISLVAFCSRGLDEAEKRVDLLLRGPTGELFTRPFEDSGNAEPMT
jgi:exodeoxyribonuclease VII small subunit